ncbi:histidinol-phosphatase HisJ family protein [Natronincola ferrireducens]|uniref:Histidinol-phosphatase n=1 Tax=Natronincola ferrireducens TaxID=393762 RepID=A0A1G9A4F1_9FIRM|nr:histidinol-phosphatase HisJ family protein [Natronincola ferrireducens]SDK21465.1 histidinol-phosphatase (PHP family) [Natronincola ferrireducens]
MYDFHVHSNFSPDSSMKMKEAIEAAIKQGVKELCFTDHTDYDYDGNNNDFQFDFYEYFSSIEELQKIYEGKITIHKGVEFGLQPHILDRYKEDVKAYSFDFILGSIHSVEKKDLFFGNFFDNKEQKTAYAVYFQELSYVVDNYTDYSVLGHLDIIKRYGGFDMALPLEEYKDFTVNILKKVIEKGKGIELNTSGLRYKLGDYHPSIDIVKLYHDLGGEIITLGSDSHQPQHLAFDFPNALKHLKNIGFKYVTTFQKLQPNFHSIDRILNSY